MNLKNELVSYVSRTVMGAQRFSDGNETIPNLQQIVVWENPKPSSTCNFRPIIFSYIQKRHQKQLRQMYRKLKKI